MKETKDEVDVELSKKWRNEQIQLKKRIKFLPYNIDKLKIIAGIDIAYWKHENKEYGVCCIVLIDYQTKEIMERVQCMDVITVPYISGFLGYRELPLILQTVKLLKNKPDIYMFDGNGYLHEEHMGIATQASFYLKTPTIGVAKSYHKIKDIEYIEPPHEIGRFNYIKKQDDIYGCALRTQKDCNTIFVSVGNYLTLDVAKDIVLSLITKESHIPMPTRLADIETHSWRTYYQKIQESFTQAAIDTQIELRVCDTHEINCFTCVGKENCQQYATPSLNTNSTGHFEKISEVPLNNAFQCPKCGRPLKCIERDADNSVPTMPVQALDFYCTNIDCDFEASL